MLEGVETSGVYAIDPPLDDPPPELLCSEVLSVMFSVIFSTGAV